MLHIKSRRRNGQKGFTLLEVLLVVAIIAILAGIVIIAINPGKQLGDSRNAQRSSDVTTIINALYQYILDNNGTLPPAGSRTGAVAISTTATEICNTTTSTCTGLVDLAVLDTAGKYLVGIPKDPKAPDGCGEGCGANGTGYTVKKDANGRLTIAVMTLNQEQSKAISVTR